MRTQESNYFIPSKVNRTYIYHHWPHNNNNHHNNSNSSFQNLFIFTEILLKGCWWNQSHDSLNMRFNIYLIIRSMSLRVSHCHLFFIKGTLRLPAPMMSSSRCQGHRLGLNNGNAAFSVFCILAHFNSKVSSLTSDALVLTSSWLHGVAPSNSIESQRLDPPERRHKHLQRHNEPTLNAFSRMNVNDMYVCVCVYIS